MPNAPKSHACAYPVIYSIESTLKSLAVYIGGNENDSPQGIAKQHSNLRRQHGIILLPLDEPRGLEFQSWGHCIEIALKRIKTWKNCCPRAPYKRTRATKHKKQRPEPGYSSLCPPCSASMNEAFSFPKRRSASQAPSHETCRVLLALLSLPLRRPTSTKLQRRKRGLPIFLGAHPSAKSRN